MTSRRETANYQLFILAQLASVILTYVVCLLAVLGVYHDGGIAVTPYAKYLLVLFTALVFEALARPGVLRFQASHSRRLAWRLTVRQWAAMAIALLVLLVFSRDLRISRIFLGVFMGSSAAVLFLGNQYGFRWVANFLTSKSDSWHLRTAVIGPPDWCRSITDHLSRTANMFQIVAVEETESHPRIDDVHRRLDGKEIDLLVAAAYHFDPQITTSLIRRGERSGFRTWIPVELSRQLGRRFTIERVGRIDVLTPPPEPLENTLNSVFKRCFDFAVALLVVAIVLPPCMLLVWALQRRYSPGPLFYLQDRVGVNNAIFRIIKFRTMQLGNGDEGRQATPADDRVYRGARFLRKLSIDEFPQFLNVLMGHMSIVGPRPHMVCHEHEFQNYFERYGMRRQVKPGITGLAQVRGFRGEVSGARDIRGRARYDVLYVRSWSFMLDLRIMAATALVVVHPPATAY